MKKPIIIDNETFTRSKKKLQKILKEKELHFSLSEVSNILAQTFGFKNEYDFQQNYSLFLDKKEALPIQNNKIKSQNYINYEKMIDQNNLFFKEMKKRKGTVFISGPTGKGKTTLSEYLSKLVFNHHKKLHIIETSKIEIDQLNNFNYKFNFKTGIGKGSLIKDHAKTTPTIISVGDIVEHDFSGLKIENRMKDESDYIKIIKSLPNTLFTDVDHFFKQDGFVFIEATSLNKIINKKQMDDSNHHILNNLKKMNLEFYFHISKCGDLVHVYGLDIKTGVVLNYIEFDEYV